MKNRRNYYRILHVQPDAPAEIIRASYRTLMQRLRMHPDLGGDVSNAALINEAFAALDDPSRRAAYDRSRRRVVEERAERRRADAAAQAAAAPALEAPRAAAICVCAFCGTPHNAADSARPRAACASCGSPLHAAVKLSPDGARRALPRKPRIMPVAFCLSWPARVLLTGTTEDVSISGMRLTAGRELPIEALLRIDCEFCSAVGVVRSASRRVGARPQAWTIGVEFLTVSVKRPLGNFVSTAC
jgi:hypothetical protein